jgi:hypothetical protein
MFKIVFLIVASMLLISLPSYSAEPELVWEKEINGGTEYGRFNNVDGFFQFDTIHSNKIFFLSVQTPSGNGGIGGNPSKLFLGSIDRENGNYNHYIANYSKVTKPLAIHFFQDTFLLMSKKNHIETSLIPTPILGGLNIVKGVITDTDIYYNSECEGDSSVYDVKASIMAVPMDNFMYNADKDLLTGQGVGNF